MTGRCVWSARVDDQRARPLRRPAPAARTCAAAPRGRAPDLCTRQSAAPIRTTFFATSALCRTINWERSPKEESAAPRRVLRRLAGSDWPLEVSDASRNHNALSFARCDDWRLRTGRLIIKMVSGVVQCAGRTPVERQGGRRWRPNLRGKTLRDGPALTNDQRNENTTRKNDFNALNALATARPARDHASDWVAQLEIRRRSTCPSHGALFPPLRTRCRPRNRFSITLHTRTGHF